MMREDCGSILFAFVSACVVNKNLNTPNWSSMADDAIMVVLYQQDATSVRVICDVFHTLATRRLFRQIDIKTLTRQRPRRRQLKSSQLFSVQAHHVQDCDQSYASKVLHLLPTFFIFHDKISFNKNYSKFNILMSFNCS